MRRVTSFLLLLAGPVPALAHDAPPTRQMVVQVDEQGVALLLAAEVVNHRARWMLAQADLNRDGALDAGEERLLAAAVVQRALGGVELLWDGAPARLVAGVPELERGGATLLRAHVLLLADDPAGHAAPSGRIEVALKPGYGRGEVLLQLLGTWRGPQGERVRRAMLPDGGRVALAVRRVAMEPPP